MTTYYIMVEEPETGELIHTHEGLTVAGAQEIVRYYQACYAIDTDLPRGLWPATESYDY